VPAVGDHAAPVVLTARHGHLALVVVAQGQLGNTSGLHWWWSRLVEGTYDVVDAGSGLLVALD